MPYIRRSGYICISLPSERLQELEVPMMVEQNEDPHRTAYTVTVDYKYGAFLRTRISALVARAELSAQARLPEYLRTTVR